MKIAVRCRLCGENNLKHTLALDGNNDLGQAYELSECQDCGTWQVNTPVSAEVVRKYFMAPERWQLARDPDGQTVDPLLRLESRRKEYEKYATTLSPLLNPGDKVVDIGAGGGLMLSLVPDNFKKLAVEPHPKAAEAARQRGLEVSPSWAEELNFPASHLTAIIMNQSLDHLLDPCYLLTQVTGWLRPGGFLLLSGLINPQCLMARLYGPKFRLWHPLHQIYPTPTAMVKVLSARGLEVLHWWQPYFSTPYGSASKLCRAVPEVLAQILAQAINRKRRKTSPPWFGNTYSLLAQKKVLTLDLKNPVLI